MHPTGAKAAARLAEAGFAMPDGWAVRQDHGGLVVGTAVGSREADVIAWCVRAGTALCRTEMTRCRRALVYLSQVG